MFQKTLTVKYVITSKTCYCYLSERCYRLLEQGRVIEMLHKNNKFYLSCTQLMNMGDNELGLNATYARNLGIREDDSVIIRAVYNFPSVKLLTICTKSQDDYDIIGMLAQDIQSTLLDQVRVVYLNQTIVIWISNSLYVVATVENVQPSAPGRLDYLTEVLVLPPKMKKKKLKDEEVMATQKQTSNFLKYFRLSRSNNIVDKSKVVTDSLNMWRLNRFSALECIKNNKFKQAFHVFAFRESIPNYLKSKDSKSEIVIMAMDHIKPPKANNHFADDEICTKKIYVRLLIVEDFNEKTNGILSQKYDLFCSDEVFSYLSAKVGSKVTLEQQELQNDCIDEIEIYGKHSKDCAEKFKNLVSDHVRDLKYVLLNADVPIQIGFDTCTIKMNDKLYGLVDSNTIRNCNLKTTDGYVKYIEKEINASPRAYFTEFGNYDQIIRNCLDSLKKGYKDHRLENILITGRSGTGKTTLATVLADTVQVSPYYVHVESLNCKTLKGKSMESLTKVLHAAFENLIYYQPSLLIVDDLNAICERVVDSDAPTQESLLFNRASETLAEFIGSYTKDNVIAIVATCESITTLNANIFSSRGRHLFKDVLNIVDLNKNDRKLFLKHLFHAKKIADVDLDAITLETEGYVVQDLADFVDKAIFESYKESAPLNSTHCERALMKCSSSNLRDVRLHSPGDRTFDDVGGLDNVKNILVETFLWPARYSSLFAAAPLRLQTGLLLYGPPGTGKTLLAGAAAKQCGLRLISVKGPELLSKYIGASEQAVRDVFQRAQSAKPCILFFDEFDSLAPRRGHDSTGVTDRVVNQFLTQLDGVESLTGVCVLAATSRPDLLDPALLRPGRLDKQLVCSLPDLKSRVAILRALSRKMKLSRTVSLEKIAQSTDGYSGADLQSVLYTAQLSSVEKLLEEKKGATIEREEQVEIKQNDIDEAVKHTRPSLTKEEKLKYDRIYARFQGKPDASDLKNMKQRATLA